MWLSSAACFRFRLQMKRCLLRRGRRGGTACFQRWMDRGSKRQMIELWPTSGCARVSASGPPHSLRLIHCHSLTPIGHTNATQWARSALQAVKLSESPVLSVLVSMCIYAASVVKHLSKLKHDNYVCDDDSCFYFPLFLSSYVLTPVQCHLDVVFHQFPNSFVSRRGKESFTSWKPF